MRSHRLNRLALLTQGVALIGLGASDMACSKEPVADPIHVNSPPQDPPPQPAADAASLPRPTMNAPFFPRDAGPTTDSGK